MFRKITAKKPPKNIDTPDINKTPDAKKTNPLDAPAKAFGAGAVAGEAFNLVNKLQNSTNPVDRFVGRVMEFAQDQGKNAEKLQQELGEREVLISQLLQYMPEQLLAKYFDEFLFVRDIPWTMTREFMGKAVKAEDLGGNARDVLDFALVFYDKRRNFGNTISIIDSALELQPQMRNVNIFKALKESLSGSRSAGISFMLIGSQNVDKAIVLNKLIGMVAARGAEDLEVLRREYQKSKDQLQRKREVSDRFRGIYDTLLSMEFQSALKRNVQFITEQFALAANDPDVQAFARILYDIKLGQEFRKEAFAPLEGRSTAETSPSSSSLPQGTRDLRAKSNLRFVKAQAAKKSITPAFRNDFQNYIAKLLERNNFLLQVNSSINKNDPLAVNLSKQVEPFLKSTNTILTDILTKIKGQNPDFQSLYDNYYDALGNYDSIENILSQSGVKLKQSQTDNMFVKISQGNANPIITPPGAAVNVTGDTSGIAGGSGRLFSQELADLSTKLFQGVAGVTVVGGVLLGDLKSALAAGTALFLHSKNKDAINIAKTAGLEVPKDQTDEQTLKTAEEVFLSLGANNQQVKEYLANAEFIKEVSSNINIYEKNLLLIIDAEVRNSDGSESAPLESPEKVDKAYKDFMNYLKQANQVVSRQVDLVNTLFALASKSPDATVQQKLGSLTNLKQDTFGVVETIRAKISEFGSLAVIIGNIQKQKFLMQKLKEILPQLDKYLATGLSAADVLAGEGGLLDKVRDYINIERDSYNKLFQEYNQLITQFPSLRNTSTAPEAPQGQANIDVPATIGSIPTPTNPNNVAIDSSGNISEGGDIQDYSRRASVQFSNLIFERNIKLAANDPQQQAKYNYYISKMNQPGINVQNLIRALDGDITFTDANLKMLARNAIMTKFTGSETTTPQPEGSFTNEQGQNVAPSEQQSQQTTTSTGVQPRPGSMQLAQEPLDQQSTTGQPLPSQAETDIFKKVKEIYAEFEKQFGNYGIMPSMQTVQSDPKRMIASMRTQLAKVFANIQTMEKMYYQILQNPTDLGGIMQGLRKSSLNKFVKQAKFQKIDDNKEVEADVELENYWNDLLPGIGTALEHSPKYRNKTTDELPVHKHPKFKKI